MRPAALPPTFEGLTGTAFGDLVEQHEVLASTIDSCRARADEGAPEGVVIVARAQERGRGQRGNAWFSPPGTGLYLSALLRPPLAPRELPSLPLVAGLAACEALREDVGVDAWLKAPNDLVAALDGRWLKVGGILVDTAVQGDVLRHAIVSLGVNCQAPPHAFPREISGLATSLEDLGAPTSPESVAVAFLVRLARWREAMSAEPATWRGELERRHERLVRAVRAGQVVAAS